MARGLVCADHFEPVRQWLNREKLAAAPLKRQVRARVLAMTNGRWELARPLKALTMEERLERAFDRAALLCRETAGDLNWPEALRLLRLWEYTGRVRRGYFIEGLSGVQYIRDSEFAGIRNAMEQPDSRVQWLPAVDPAQPWGKALSHGEGRRFLNVPGTAVALRAGVPVAVLERQGTLRIFSGDSLPEVLKAFVLAFSGRRIYPALRRLTLREYPPDASQALAEAGFSREMQDFVLYRGIQ